MPADDGQLLMRFYSDDKLEISRPGKSLKRSRVLNLQVLEY